MLDQPADRLTYAQRKAAERKSMRPTEHAGGWTDDRIETLVRMWGEGFSGSEIAVTLGGGVTRNGVIGKVHRMGLAERKTRPANPKPKAHGNKGRPKANAIVARAEQRRAEAAKPARVQRMAEPVETPLDDGETDGVDVTGLLGILQLTEHTCKWPIGDPKDKRFGFCGAHSEEGKPYCADHAARAYQGFTPGYPAGQRK